MAGAIVPRGTPRIRKVLRRSFARLVAAAGTGFHVSHAAAARFASPSDLLDIAVAGIGGQGAANLKAVTGHTVVAPCGVDERAGKAFPANGRAGRFADGRSMFDEMEKGIDAVVISTHDHTQFHPDWWALERGKHVSPEKPMVHEVDDVRRLTFAAGGNELATYLGVQRLRWLAVAARQGVHRVRGAGSAIAAVAGVSPGVPGRPPGRAGRQLPPWL